MKKPIKNIVNGKVLINKQSKFNFLIATSLSLIHATPFFQGKLFSCGLLKAVSYYFVFSVVVL